jgi:integrase
MATVRKHRNRWVADFRDQYKRRRIETPKGLFETKALEKRAAQELLEKRVTEVATYSFTPSRERLTFRELAARWLTSKVRIRETTASDYRIMLDCYLLPYFANRKVEGIRRLDIERFRAELSAGLPAPIRQARESKLRDLQVGDPSARLKPLTPGPRTVNKCLGVLVSLFTYAVRHELMTRNPADRIEKLPTAAGEGRVIEQNVLTPADLQRVIDSTREPFRIPVMLAAYTGARQAEVLGLQWSDIDWNRRTAEIRRTYRCGAFYQPKTPASRRTVELPAELVSELKRWRLRCPKGEHDLVCPSVTGRPMQGSALLQQGFLPALRRAGVRRVRFHDLRHSFASNLLANGADIVTVQSALGHANAHITLSTYSHVVPKARHGAADRMAALIRESGYKMETLGSAEAVSELDGSA